MPGQWAKNDWLSDDAITHSRLNDIGNSMRTWGYGETAGTVTINANSNNLANVGTLTAATVNCTGPVAVTGDVSIGNSSGDANNTFRLDGFTNTLFLVAGSAPGAATGTRIILKAATAGAGDGVEALVVESDATVSLSAGINQATFTTAGLINSWVAFGGGRPAVGLMYRKDKQNNLWLVGAIKNGTTANGTSVMILPPGFRPTYVASAPVLASASSGAYVDLLTTGEVQIQNVTSSAFILFNICIPIS